MAAAWDEKAVFLAALALPPEQRSAYLDGACPTPIQRERIENLLRHHTAAQGDYLASGPTVVARPPDATRQIDEFRLLHPIGEGGMGRVYLAEDTVLGRRVALKLLSRHLSGSEAAIGRFRSEARSAAALKHPGIVPVFRFGVAGDEHYLVSEYVDGRTLGDLINDQRNRQPAQSPEDVRRYRRQAAEIVAGVADALDAAHRANIVHRDVKPSNILLESDGRPRLTDFGIAKHLGENAGGDATRIIGTCHYMSPEQASIAGAQVDRRSDVFSLGVVLYELLALRRPFEGSDPREVLRAVLERDPVSLRKVDRSIPRDLETICFKAMDKDPTRRYQSAAHVAADLRSFLSDQPILASPPGLGRQLRRWVIRRRLRVVFGVLVIFAVLTAGLALKLIDAAAQQKAWLQVESDVPAHVVIRRFDPVTLELEPEGRSLGNAPLPRVLQEPGQYRVTVAPLDGSSVVEFNWVAFSRGAANRQTLHVHRAGDSSRHAFNSSVLCGRVPSTASDPADMTLVPAGNYVVGYSNAAPEPFVRREQRHVAAFLIDRYEVSNAEYREFVDASGHPPPRIWVDHGYDPHLADRPVVGVRLQDAEAYARWRGKRLPTATEWQAAARGPEGRVYPWGDAWNSDSALQHPAPEDFAAANTRDQATRFNRYRAATVEVRRSDGYSTRSQVMHLFGNVRELTGTVTAAGGGVFVGGRSWADSPQNEHFGAMQTFPINTQSYQNGFRCAMSAARAAPGR